MKNRLVNTLEPIITDECDYVVKNRIVIKKEPWVPVKSLSRKLGVSKQTVLERIRKGQYRAKTLFGLILVKDERSTDNDKSRSNGDNS